MLRYRKGPGCREKPAAFFHAKAGIRQERGRNAFENSQPGQVLKYSRLECSDANPPP